jgi:hypothetical protein
MERPDKSAAEFWPIFNKKRRKGPNFKKIISLPHTLSNAREVQEIFPLAQTKIAFLKPKFLQIFKTTWGTEFFSLAAVYFFWTGRKVLQKVGNTGITVIIGDANVS